MKIEECWAKTTPFQSVITHGIVSGYVAQTMVRSYLSAGTSALLKRSLNLDQTGLEAFIGYLASLHDIGKLECNFQAKDPVTGQLLRSDPVIAAELAVPISNVRHEKTGQECLSEIWEQAEEDFVAIDLFAPVVGAHHPGKSGKGNFRINSRFAELQKEFAALMQERFLGQKSVSLPSYQEDREGVLGAALLAIIIMADWIASGPAFADAEDWAELPEAKKNVIDKTEVFLQRSGLGPQRWRSPDRFCEVWPWISAQGRRPLQRQVDEMFRDASDRYNLILLEAPMGEGKTEAGVYAALQLAKMWGKDGFYIALPTAATSNQMVLRMRELLRAHDLDADVRLLHGMAWLETAGLNPAQSEEADGIANWLAPVRRGLLGQFAVGTVDQAMLAATNVKYGALRLLGLSNKVLIIDEIHSYDAYMSGILVRLLQWCKAFEIPVVMLSATLPPAKKEELFQPYVTGKREQRYPLITAITSDGAVVEREVTATSHCMSAKVELLPILNHPDLIAEAAIRLANTGGCICVLMNTVREAQAVYSAIKKIFDGDLLLFHAQFLAQRRAELEALCIRHYGKDRTHRPKRSILVATQVVEQSLDVDFDAMLSAVAPIDLLIQRLGRVHRHDGVERPNGLEQPILQVLTPAAGEDFGSSQYVYPECLLKSCMRLLREQREIRIPEDIAPLVRRGYDPNEAPPDEMIQWRTTLIREQVESGASQQFLANKPENQYNALMDTLLYDDENSGLSVATRLGEPSIRVALLEPALFEKLLPYSKEKNGALYAEVWQKHLAEAVMLQSVSLRDRRKNFKLSDLWDIKGDRLLSGTRIFKLVDGLCSLGNGAQILNDPDLGVQIREGEL